jgi:hypothetical protein
VAGCYLLMNATQRVICRTVTLRGLARPFSLRRNYEWLLPRPQSGLDRSDGYVVSVFALLGAVDLAWICAVAYSASAIDLALRLHRALIVAAVCLVEAVPQMARTLAAIGAPSFLLIGPLGAAGVLLILLSLWSTRWSSALLQECHKRLSCKTSNLAFDVYGTIIGGRSIRPAHNEFCLDRGSLRAKQARLEQIGLKYVQGYLPPKLALRNPEPSIPVQAAAVFVKPGEQQKAKVKSYVAASKATSSVVGYERSLPQERGLLKCIDSGLLDPSEVQEARVRATRYLYAASMMQIGDFTVEILRCRLLPDESDHENVCPRLRSLLGDEDSDVQHVHANSLLRLGRLDELRQLLGDRFQRRKTSCRLRAGCNVMKTNLPRAPHIAETDCLIMEGCYTPYVPGGVSSSVHRLMRNPNEPQPIGYDHCCQN